MFSIGSSPIPREVSSPLPKVLFIHPHALINIHNDRHSVLKTFAQTFPFPSDFSILFLLIFFFDFFFFLFLFYRFELPETVIDSMENLELFFDDDVGRAGMIPIDLDSFLDGIPNPSPENILLDATAVSPSESAGSWIDEIEKMLMEDGDDGGKEVCESFLADLIVDSPVEGMSGSGEVVDVSSCDEKKVGVSEEEEKAVDGRERDGSDDEDDDGVSAGEAVGVGESDDPVSMKKRRQLRNRDAASRSRERKKVYVKELEMKSKYLESECLRLGRMLQCVVAENQALRFSLQNGSAYGASVNKQESAVLLLESLLLGSLLWSLGVMCLFNLPPSIQPVLDVALLENVGKIEPETPAPRGTKSEKLRLFNAGSFLTSRKCKASRTKIKSSLLVALVLH